MSIRKDGREFAVVDVTRLLLLPSFAAIWMERSEVVPAVASD
jgi:hypothetical protein